MLYEIIELENGEIVLKRADQDREHDDEPLVTIRFSEEAMFFLDDAKIDVAKAMIEAGLTVAGDLSGDPQDEELLDDLSDFDDTSPDDPTLH